MLSDYVRFAIDGIKGRKLRSWLTMVGIFIGIIAVVSLISLGQGLQNVIDEQFKNIGADRIMVTPGGGGIETSNPMMGRMVAAKLSQGDLEAVRGVKGVENAMGILTEPCMVGFKDKRKYGYVLSFPTDPDLRSFIEEIDYFKIDKGRNLRAGDKYAATAGPDAGKHFFGSDFNVGDRITLEGAEFTIVGINKKSGNPMHDMQIKIPLDTGREIFDKPDEFSMISVKAKKGFEPSDVAEDIKEKLRKHRHVKEGEEDFSVETAANAIATFKSILSMVQAVLIGIAAISLVVGGVGITTTMYTSVLERTRQIGVMKSVGARNNDILMIFLVEAGLLGLVGGAIGVAIGLSLSKGLEFILVNFFDFDLLKPYVSWWLVLGALSFSFLVGCISGFIPARRAAKMNPVDALRYR